MKVTNPNRLCGIKKATSDEMALVLGHRDARAVMVSCEFG